MVSAQVFPIGGSEEVPMHLRPSQPVECPEYTILSNSVADKRVTRITPSRKQAALMLPRHASPYQRPTPKTTAPQFNERGEQLLQLFPARLL